ncbi:MAG: hypothetical protein KDI51_01400 [Xanthomonadales bacterium]|nr:hypothetical protein [Xanthomonadales bacterium]MCB1633209.1 hypothetical protein [Xanthomonadales bacterium]
MRGSEAIFARAQEAEASEVQTAEDRPALEGLIKALVRDTQRGCRRASLLLMLAVAYVARPDIKLPPTVLWKVPSVAVH